MTENPQYSFHHSGRMLAARAALGLSVSDFAAKFRIKRRTIQRIETGDDPTPIGLWADVQEALDELRTNIDSLVTEFDEDGVTEPLIDRDEPGMVQAAAILMIVMDRGQYNPTTASDMETTDE